MLQPLFFLRFLRLAYIFALRDACVYALSEGGANYHVVHGAGKAASQARNGRRQGLFRLQSYCLLNLNAAMTDHQVGTLLMEAVTKYLNIIFEDRCRV